jgi:hypothetical protein
LPLPNKIEGAEQTVTRVASRKRVRVSLGQSGYKMHDADKKPTYSGNLGYSSPVQDSERRGSDRVQLIATAEVIELKTGARFKSRTTDLGPGGCFVDIKTPFPVGTKVRVNLIMRSSNFEAPGVVVYSQYGLGMGVSFEEMTPPRREAFAAWLGGCGGEQHAVYEAPAPPLLKSFAAAAEPDRATLQRLIHLLVGKGILTEAEGATLLQNREPLP